ncbi:hypothetical protein FSP39_018219 [Pinctada imbricata]|uniref:Tyr recombinase domain-containing protein n=1 Tax=Pinctada imbricata TaxID=66713 RepID=A0AA88XK94_PINIB|nr:hypothetical protein FSP39_018219 [Pinctada imbricata]
MVEFENVDPNYLANLLREFYASATPKFTEGRQKSLPPNQAQEYHKNTLRNLRAAINRHLRNIGSEIDIVKDRAFAKANALLDAKLKLMVKSGSSRPTQHKKIISENDLKKICTYLDNDDDPQILQYNVWYYLAIHFVSRGLEFHHQLTLHSFLFLFDDTGRDYVTLGHETQQKNIQGGLSNQEAVGDKRMHATGVKGCPVGALRKFLGHCDPCAPVLFCRLKVRVNGEIWYTCKPLSKRLFSKFMADICKNAECSLAYTVHSVRTTAIQLLSHSGVETRHIMMMSGHRNEASVRSYSRDCSESLKRKMSDRLANVSDSSIPSSSTALMPISEQLQTTVSVDVNNVSVPNSLSSLALPSNSIGSEASQLKFMNSMTSLSSAQGILTHSSFNNCQFSFVIGKGSQ